MTGRLARLAAAFRPSTASLAVVAVVSVVSAAVFVAVAWSFTWTSDITRNLQAAEALRAGRFGSVEGYLYSPFAALLTVPLLALPSAVAIIGWLVAKVAVLLGGAAIATRGLDSRWRVLIAFAAVAFLPIVHDLLLGNVTVAIAAAVALVAWDRDRPASGVPLGIVVAAAPKPALLPVLVWMLVRRPRALVGLLVAALVATLVTLPVVGPDALGAWIATLRNPPILSGGNFAVTSWPPVLAAIASGATILATAVAIRRGAGPGLVCALCCGLLVSNYTVLYGAGILLPAVPLLARVAPRATIGLALTAPVGLLVAFPLWVGAIIVVTLAVPAASWAAAASALTAGQSQAGSAAAIEVVPPPLLP